MGNTFRPSVSPSAMQVAIGIGCQGLLHVLGHVDLAHLILGLVTLTIVIDVKIDNAEHIAFSILNPMLRDKVRGVLDVIRLQFSNPASPFHRPGASTVYTFSLNCFISSADTFACSGT